MLAKIALFVASLAAALALAFALAAAGFGPAAAPGLVGALATPSATGAAATPQTQIDRVYVASPPPRRTVTIHKVVKASGGAESDGAEGGD